MVSLRRSLICYFVLLFFSCSKDIVILTNKSTISLPFAEINIDPVFMAKSIFSNDFPKIHYFKEGSDSLALVKLRSDFNLYSAFKNHIIFNNKLEGDVINNINTNIINSINKDIDTISEVFSIDTFSNVSDSTSIKFNLPIEIKIPIYNGFNKTMFIQSDFDYLDKNNNLVNGVRVQSNISANANSSNTMVISISNFSNDVRKIITKFKFTFPNGSPDNAIIQKNNLPIYIDSITIDIPLDLEIKNLKFKENYFENFNKDNIFYSEKNKNINISYLFIESSLGEKSSMLPISGLGVNLNFLDENHNLVIKETLNLLPQKSIPSIVEIKEGSIEKIKAAKYINFSLGHLEGSNIIKIRLVKDFSLVNIRYKIVGNIEYNL